MTAGTDTGADLELDLLGVALTAPEITRQLDLSAAEFADARHGAVWEAIRGLDADGVRIVADPVLILDRIGPETRVDHDLVLSLIYRTGFVQNAATYAEKIRERYRRRRVLDALHQGVNLAEVGAPLDEVAAKVGPALDGATAPAADAGAGSSWRPADLTELLNGTHVTPEPTLMPRADGVCLLYPGLTHSFHGESESGKSLAAQAEAARVLNAGGRVLFLDFESDLKSVFGRLIELGADPAAMAERFHYVQPEESLRSSPAAADFKHILAESYDLAVVDGVTASLGLFGGSTTDNDDVTVWARALPDRIARETGAAVVCVDHVTKDSESRGRFAIGGQAKMAALTGAAYVVEVLEPLGRGLRGVVAMRVAKDRPGFIRAHSGQFRAKDRTQEAARIVVDSTGPRAVVTVDSPRTDVTNPGPFRPTGLMEKLSRHLEAAGPSSGYALRTAVAGKDTGKLEALAVLIAEGFVTVTDGPRNSKLHTSVRPYRQAEDPQSDHYSPREQVSSSEPPATCSPSKAGEQGNRSRTCSGNRSGTGGEQGTGGPGSWSEADLLRHGSTACRHCGNDLISEPGLTARCRGLHERSAA